MPLIEAALASKNLNSAPEPAGSEFLTADPRMLALLEFTRRASRSHASILIQGESGTGKELLARYIHNRSRRHGGPFIAVNCAALPEGLLESELFGQERSAFTGAVGYKAGKFALAHGGTLLLDEISEMPLALQAKLLRVLQEREVDRVAKKTAADRYSCDLDHQSRSARNDPCRSLSRRAVLPFERRAVEAVSAARAQRRYGLLAKTFFRKQGYAGSDLTA